MNSTPVRHAIIKTSKYLSKTFVNALGKLQNSVVHQTVISGVPNGSQVISRAQLQIYLMYRVNTHRAAYAII